MTDIVERLRKPVGCAMIDGQAFKKGDPLYDNVRMEAADEIDRLRGLLLQFVEYVEQDTEWPDIVAEARSALAGTTESEITGIRDDARRWQAACRLSRQIQDRELRGIVTSFLDDLAYGKSKFDMQDEINARIRNTVQLPASTVADGQKP